MYANAPEDTGSTRARALPFCAEGLATQAEALNQVAIPLDVLFSKVIKQTAALIHHAQQTAA
jgi:hypothetical protein